MSILTDYYRFDKIGKKSITRLDCTDSTGSYPEFEDKRATKLTKANERRDATNVGDLVIYLGDVPKQFGGNAQRKADKSLTIKGKNLSSMYVPDVTNNFAYGDVRGTTDALLFVFDNLVIVDGRVISGGLDVFVARGKCRDRVSLYNLLCDGELDEEMSSLKEMAKAYKTLQ